jgi:sulfate transport system substrate-binding protein
MPRFNASRHAPHANRDWRIAILALVAAACTGAGAEGADMHTLTLGAYTTPREVYGREILPAFAQRWADSTGQTVEFAESYLGSGAQARAIVGGFEADVAALSLEPDVQSLVDAGLVRPEWNATPTGGMVSRSIVVIAVRPGNPKRIADWDDLTRPDVDVVTPNPKTSGGAMWNIAALYGATMRERGGSTAADSAAAEARLRTVLSRVRIMDKGAREAMLTFENGIGDAAITYENEVLVARKSGQAMDYVIPPSTLLIENPVAVVHEYAERHGTLAMAEAFTRFLITPEMQRRYAAYGLRPVDSLVAAETASEFPPVRDLFTIRDMGGWPAVIERLFAPGGAFDRASAAAVASGR